MPVSISSPIGAIFLLGNLVSFSKLNDYMNRIKEREMFIDIVIVLLIVVAFLSSGRIIIGPSVWDRLLGFSLLCSKIIIIIILYSYANDQSIYLDIALAFAVLGFVGTVSIAKFLQKTNKE